MNGLQRSLAFVHGKAVDRPPFHPIVMRWAARQAGVSYRDFCLDYRAKAEAMLFVAREFGADWVTVMSDPYCEAEAFGVEVEYPPDGLPLEKGGHLQEAQEAFDLKPYRWEEQPRMRNRVREIEAMKAAGEGGGLSSAGSKVRWPSMRISAGSRQRRWI